MPSQGDSHRWIGHNGQAISPRHSGIRQIYVDIKFILFMNIASNDKEDFIMAGRTRLSDEIRRRQQKPRGIPSVDQKLGVLKTLKEAAQLFAEKLSARIQDLPELSHLTEGDLDTPLLPLTYCDINQDGETGFQLIGHSTLLEVRTSNSTDNPYVSLTLYVTQDRLKKITDPSAQKIVFEEYVTLYPEELIESVTDFKNTGWNFERAAIAISICEGYNARCGLYHEWPGYGLSKNVFRCLPEALRPSPEKSGRLSFYDVDEPILPRILRKLGELRQGTHPASERKFDYT